MSLILCFDMIGLKNGFKKTLATLVAAATLAGATGCHVSTKFRSSADFDRNGLPDLVEVVEIPASLGSDNVVIDLQMPNGNYKTLRYNIGRNSTVDDLYITDYNCDGLPDIIVSVSKHWPYHRENWQEVLLSHGNFFSKKIVH